MTNNKTIKINDEDIIMSYFASNYKEDLTFIEKELNETLDEKEYIPCAVKTFMKYWDKYKTFALIKAGGLYCWIKHGNDILQNNIFINEVYPFTKDQMYLPQQIKKEYSFI